MLSIHDKNSYNDFSELYPILKRITIESKNKCKVLNSKLSYIKYDSELYNKVQDEINLELERWSRKMRSFGLTPISYGSVRTLFGNVYKVYEDWHENLSNYLLL